MPTTLSLTSVSADSIVDSIGINVHGGYGAADRTDNTNSYRTNFVPLLTWLGVRYIRDTVYDPTTGGLSYTQSVANAALQDAAGIKALRIISGSTYLSTLTSNYPQPIAVEPYNEYDLTGGSWLSTLTAFQPTLYSTVKTAWPSCVVLGPSCGHNPTGYDALTDMRPNIDANNVHVYPRPGNNPAFFSALAAPWVAAHYQNAGPTKPIWVTESGLNSTCIPTDANSELTDHAAAVIHARILWQALGATTSTTLNSSPYPTGLGGLGAVKVFIYELLDQHLIATTVEDRFGLFTADHQPKPAAWMIRNTISLLSDPGASITPISISVTLGTLGQSNLSTVLMQKADGSLWLAYWAASSNSVSNPGGDYAGFPITGPDIDDSGRAFTFTFAASYPGAQIFRPMTGIGPTQALSIRSGTAYTLNATFDPQFIRLAQAPLLTTPHRGLAGRYSSVIA